MSRDQKGMFTKGSSGNPDGRPKGSGLSITTEIKRKLTEVDEAEKSTYLQLLVDKIIKLAINDGNPQMIKQIWNYIDGIPQQKIEHSGFIDRSPVLSDEEYKDELIKLGLDPKTGQRLNMPIKD